MKIIRILLAILIIVGLGLLATQQYWLPRVVETILDWETTIKIMVPATDTLNATSTVTVMDDWNWIPATTTVAGIEFMYPNPIPATYVSAVDWPPQVMRTPGVLSCTEGAMASHGGEVTTSKLRTINAQLYCVSEARQGAAGTAYTFYQYAAQKGDFVTSVSFTLKTPQCMNYDDPRQRECLTEQKAFSVDVLADRIIESITMQ